MNIFVVDENPIDAARMLCDKHVVKMIVETAQILSTVAYMRGVVYKELYAPTHIHHPCVSWAGETYANFFWLLVHGIGLSLEYTKRYDKTHKTDAVLKKLDGVLIEIWPGEDSNFDYEAHTPFVQCMPVQYRGLSAIEAYRRFYKGEKSRFAKWKYTSPPEWWNNGKSGDMVISYEGNQQGL